jgi:hypothetical protein
MFQYLTKTGKKYPGFQIVLFITKRSATAIKLLLRRTAIRSIILSTHRTLTIATNHSLYSWFVNVWFQRGQNTTDDCSLLPKFRSDGAIKTMTIVNAPSYNDSSAMLTELQNDAGSDTTGNDNSFERWLYNHQLYFKELSANKWAFLPKSTPL